MTDQHDESFIKWTIGGIVTMTAAVVGWFNGKINRVSDKKLSKDVFDEFKEGNNKQHKITHLALERIDQKLDRKQDK